MRIRAISLTAGIAVAFGALTFAFTAAAHGEEPPGKPFAGLAANTWQPVSSDNVGPRFSPGLVYVPKLQRFVLFAGRIIGRNPRPYDVQSFNASRRIWENDLPEAAKDRGPLHGNVRTVKFGNRFQMADADGLVRPTTGLTKMAYSYALAPWDGKIYTLVCGRMLCYDPVTRVWKDLDAPVGPAPKADHDEATLNWGAICADPVNREILLFGGLVPDIATGSPGSWVYSVEANTWRKLELEVEPGPRVLSPMVYDPTHRKIVLFGGDRMDMVHGDTWVYDCKTRTWSNAKPRLGPPPRLGHGLVYLPESKKILLTGGLTYSNARAAYYQHLPYLDLWVYDVGTNQWQMLSRRPWDDKLAQKDVEPAVMAAGDDDVVLYVPGDGHSMRMERTTWACRIDASQTDAAGTAKYGVADGEVVYRGGGYDPQWYETDVPPVDEKKNEAFLRSVAVNQWVAVEPPKWPEHRWGGGWATVAFDPDSDQLLFHGGGHSAYFGDEVVHYSPSRNRFSISHRPSLPLEYCGKLAGPGTSFAGAPWGVHSYHGYAYDPACKRMVYFDHPDNLYLYDPVKREWPYEERLKAPFSDSKKYWTALISTPHGVLMWARGNGLHLLKDGKKFEKLPVKDGFAAFTTDGSSLTYDSKRDVAYITTTPRSRDKANVVCGQVWAYDFKARTFEAKNPKGMNNIKVDRFARESAYIAHDDLVIFGYIIAHDGKKKIPFYDPEKNEWFAAAIAGSEFIAHARANGYAANVDLGVAYDAARQLVWTFRGRLNPGSIQVLRLERKTLNLESLGG